MSSATPKTTATKGMKISFANTPQAKADDLTLTEQDGGAYAIDVLANDLGGEAKQLWAVYAGEPGEPQVTGAPSSFAIEGVGTFSIVNGVVEFMPTGDYAARINALGEGVAGDSFSFWYVIRLANGAFAKAQAAITFEGVNDAAVITGETSATVKEDRGVEDGFLVAIGKLDVADVDTGESEFQAVTGGQGFFGTFSIDTDGNWTYRVSNDLKAVQDLRTGGDVLTDSFTFRSKDGTEQVVTVTIEGTDEPVTVALLYAPAGPDVEVPGETVNAVYPVATPAIGTSADPVSGSNGAWKSWVNAVNDWRATFAPNVDSNQTTTTITTVFGSGNNQLATFTYDNTFSYTKPGETIPGDPASLIIVSVAGDASTDPGATVVDAFLFWNADTDLTFTGATQAQFEAEVTIGLLDVDADGAMDDTVLMFTDGSTLTLFDAGFGSFAELFGSGQVTI